LRELPKQALSKLTAMNSELRAPGPYPIKFDSNLFPIGINTHASRCMANAPHLFEDLRLSDKGKVQGINDGLEIKGKGTFKFKIEDNNGQTHEIKIPNSLYIPDLERCLLSPQHWAQEAGDDHPLPEGTWCKNMATHNILFWDQKHYQKSVPHSSSTNTPVFYTAPLSRAYQAFASTFEALEAPFFRRAAESTSFNTLGKGPLQQKACLIPWISCHKIHSSPRRISTSKNKRVRWSMRE
jgi:hypothetical protein